MYSVEFVLLIDAGSSNILAHDSSNKVEKSGQIPRAGSVGLLLTRGCGVFIFNKTVAGQMSDSIPAKVRF